MILENKPMTTIKFTDEHLSIIARAMEIYSRLRAGQIKIAMEEAYPDYMLSYEECENIEQHVRNIIYPKPPQLFYDGHGGYYDQYDNTYDESGNRTNEESYEDRMRATRPQMNGQNAYFGIASKEMIDSGGTLAYEILSTLRQYINLKQNDGYYNRSTWSCDPLNLTTIPLPEIVGFEKEKRFPIKGKAIVSKLESMVENQKFDDLWDTIGKYLTKKYPELESYSAAKIEKEDNHFVVIAQGATKKK